MTSTMLDQPSRIRLRPPAVPPVRRRAPVRGPLARPKGLPPMPPSRLGDGAVRGCRVDAVSQASGSWRLTDRGIALVLVLTALIVLAAVTVIGLTAWRVTSPGYSTTAVSEVSSR
jgi:hypothetical protein